MSSPTFDLNKVQYTSLANSYKNDSQIYKGSLTVSASIPAGSFLTASTTQTLSYAPVFSQLYGYFQEYVDTFQQYNVGSGYNGKEWYLANIDTRLGIHVTSGQTSVIDGLLYCVLNGTQLTVSVIINNPFNTTLTYDALTVPYAFFVVTLIT